MPKKKNRKYANHRADDKRCPCRDEYLELRQKLSNNNKQLKQTNRRPTFSFSENDFPNTLNNKGTIFTKPWYIENSQDDGKYKHHKTDDDNDISNERLLDIYFEAINALQRCKNNTIRVLGMMLKNAI